MVVVAILPPSAWGRILDPGWWTSRKTFNIYLDTNKTLLDGWNAKTIVVSFKEEEVALKSF